MIGLLMPEAAEEGGRMVGEALAAQIRDKLGVEESQLGLADELRRDLRALERPCLAPCVGFGRFGRHSGLL
ncbi:hypothetical protein DZK27_04410 [Rhodobacteraceae bacterium 63075]|nr:hypothetical protein DZK27_04410 [Rhodobacteraceae bacterium 63075]